MGEDEEKIEIELEHDDIDEMFSVIIHALEKI